MDEFALYFGMHPLGALAIVVSTVVLYLVFSLVLSRVGQRLYASPSSLDLAVVTILGAIVGRSILGESPTRPVACWHWPPCWHWRLLPGGYAAARAAVDRPGTARPPWW